MRVVLSELSALSQRTGVGHYTHELARALRERPDIEQVERFPTGWLRQACKWGAHAGPRLYPRSGREQLPPSLLRQAASSLRTRVVGMIRRSKQAVLARRFRKLAARRSFDLYHEPNYIPLPSECPTLATVHDLSALLHPEWHPADRVAYFEMHFPKAIERCVHFLADSEFTRQEMTRFLGIAPEKITRVPLGIRRGIRPLPQADLVRSIKELGLPPRYLLHVGTIEPRKNVLTLMKAYCALSAPLRARWPLLLVGSWGWNSAPVAEFWHEEGRHKNILHLGYVPDRHLAAVYQGARALVYPTFYEGFGLPPLEMMACGGAVLASNAGAVVEAVGGQAHLIPPNDVDGWRSALSRVVTDAEWWNELRRGATAVARPYTWARCAADTYQVYRTLCGKAVSAAAPAIRAA